jgi:ribosome biogenesis GTPase
MTAPNATVIAAFSRRMRLRLDTDAEADARIRGKQLRPVCGDRVAAEPLTGEPEWLITAVGPRRNALTRPNRRGRVETLAANIGLLVAVGSAVPEPDWFVVDRYLCAAELMRIPAMVVFNKTDLGSPDSALAEYRELGYPVVTCSVKSGAGIDELQAGIGKRVAIFVGQSGVGKSSITNALVGTQTRRTAAISEKARSGRHTTANSTMLPLPGGGQVIDSPGVRDYAPAFGSGRDVAAGYREISAASGDCRFGDCRHLGEPGCAVRAAVDDGRIAARRYASYRRSLDLV